MGDFPSGRDPVSDDDVAAARSALIAALETSGSWDRVRELLHQWHRLAEAQDDRGTAAECRVN